MMKNVIDSGHDPISNKIVSRAMNRWPMFLAFCLTAGGCAIGQSEYSCSGIPEGVQCHNAREVLEKARNTEGPVTNADFDKKKGKAKDKDSGGEKSDRTQTEQTNDGAARAIPIGYVPDEENDALPLRTPSRVMRIYYTPWETASGDLHVSKTVYTEVESRRWTVGRNNPVNVVRDITPLEPASPGRAAPATPRTTAATSAVPVAPSAEIVPTGTKAATSGGGFPNP